MHDERDALNAIELPMKVAFLADSTMKEHTNVFFATLTTTIIIVGRKSSPV